MAQVTHVFASIRFLLKYPAFRASVVGRILKMALPRFQAPGYHTDTNWGTVVKGICKYKSVALKMYVQRKV